MNRSINTSAATPANLRSYAIGFILSLILTIIPFWLVMEGNTARSTLLTVVIVCAVIQILVHLICFLHLNTTPQQHWNLVALVFAAIIILILVAGSLWIMWNLNINMMPD